MEKWIGIYIRDKNVPIVVGFKEWKKLHCSFCTLFRVRAKPQDQGLSAAAVAACFLQLLAVICC